MTSAAVFTTEFQTEFEAQTGRMLRRRFSWFILAVVMVHVLLVLVLFGSFGVFAVAPGSRGLLDQQIAKVRGAEWGLIAALVIKALDLGVYAWCWRRVAAHPMGRERLLRFTQWFLVYRGVSDMVVLFLLQKEGFPWSICWYHMLACIFLPWTPEQAIRPVGPLLVLNALLVLIFEDAGKGMKAFTIIMSLFVAAPGVGIAWFKHSRRTAAFKFQVMQTRFGQIRRELLDARRIHEALFPRPVFTGPVRLDYRYEPMRQIGGDYLYARAVQRPGASGGVGGEDGGSSAFNVLLLDVTGHGIAAALTVNRLYGEVERLYAENPDSGPDDVLQALNKYVHLTLATHSIYATALCVRVDPASGTMEYASGGHPPAFLCQADGRIEQLDSTSFVLGACAAADFRANAERRRFEPGDTLIAYTDGALECRNEQGRMLGVNGLLRVLASCVQARRGSSGLSIGLCGAVLSAVESHRAGTPEDDTLVVEITRATAEPAGSPKRSEALAGTAR